MRDAYKVLAIIAFLVKNGSSYSLKLSPRKQIAIHGLNSNVDASTGTKLPSSEWELDCYSRPVIVDGKKLWEVLITDSSGSFRFCKALPSNSVNSRELRKLVEQEMDSSPVKPTIIRFFRGAMFNMINIALTDLDVICRPSRCTYALADWIQERNRDVYPKMADYRANMVSGESTGILDVRTPVKLPDALRGEKYAFVGLPLAEFLPGGSIDADNIGVGRLCPIDPALPGDTFVQGVVILTPRAKALSYWLAGTEVSGLTCDLRKRNLVMETDISTEYLMARLNDIQRQEGVGYEQGKDQLGGMHFISVQTDEDEDPAGFWLLRKIPRNL